MLCIGITGGIGCGKSTVTAIFAKLGIPVIDADIIAHQLTMTGQPALEKIAQHFGQHILDEKGYLDRRALKDIIFNHAEQKSWLENLLHPLVMDEIKKQIGNISASYCIISAPLLMEVAQARMLVDRILVIDTEPNTQIQRTKQRDHLNHDQVSKIMQSQLSRELRLRNADDIIENNQDLDSLTHQIKKLHASYLALANM